MVHPVFANASVLFGWRLTPVEIYTAMAFHPEGSVIIIDESSAAPSSRLGHSVAVTTMSEINLIFRKQASVVFYVSAQDWMIAPSIRRDCKEVWMPVSKKRPGGRGRPRHGTGAQDPAKRLPELPPCLARLGRLPVQEGESDRVFRQRGRTWHTVLHHVRRRRRGPACAAAERHLRTRSVRSRDDYRKGQSSSGQSLRASATAMPQVQVDGPRC